MNFNLFDYIIIGVIALWAVLAVVYIVRRKKKGKCVGCDGDCSNCYKTSTKRKNEK